MRWKTKALAQRLFSALPLGHHMNYVLQRFVTHSLPRPPDTMTEVVQTAERHVAQIRKHLERPLGELRLFEFGAGWDLATPLAMAALGARDQLLFDIVPVARWSLIRRAASDLIERGLDLPEVEAGMSQEAYLRKVGIRYVAPGDARSTGLPKGSIDVALSTSVLEHISEPDLEAICQELVRLLAPGGICSFAIDYHDHYAGSDPAIHGLNFLRYEDADWKRWNCALQFQNRLRHGDYVKLFDGAGFDLVDVRPVNDPSFPSEPQVVERFAGRPDLGIGDGWFVHGNPSSSPRPERSPRRG